MSRHFGSVAMGRKRKHVDPLHPLPQGLFKHGRKHRAKGVEGWQYFEGDYDTVCRDYRAWKMDGSACYLASTEWLLGWYLTEIAPAKLSPRTVRDYQRDRNTIVAGIGHIPYRE